MRSSAPVRHWRSGNWMTLARNTADAIRPAHAPRSALRASVAKVRESIATRARAFPLARHAWARYRRRKYEQRISRFVEEKTGRADRLPLGAVYEATMREMHCEFCYVATCSISRAVGEERRRRAAEGVTGQTRFH